MDVTPTTTISNHATTSRPAKGQTIADPLNNLDALKSSTGNNYSFNYFYCRNDSVETNTENTLVDTAPKEDNNSKYR